MKALSGVPGLDEITGGGFPEGRLSVVAGEAGLGKTILSLQFLASVGTGCGSPGLFVAVEEIATDVVRHAREFGWIAESIDKTRRAQPLPDAPGILVLAANPDADVVQAGDFDLGGLLAIMTGVVQRTGARRVVLDGLDVLLDLLDSAAARRREILRLRDWVQASGVTTLVTSKPLDERSQPTGYEFLK